LRELGNKKILFYKFSFQYLVVKPACVNATLTSWNNSIFGYKLRTDYEQFEAENP